MEQKVIRNFNDFVAKKVEGINYVNDFKQVKTLLNNHWQNDGLYFTIEQYSNTDADILLYDNDGRFEQNHKIGSIKVSVQADSKCDIFYNENLVTLSELESELTKLAQTIKK